MSLPHLALDRNGESGSPISPSTCTLSPTCAPEGICINAKDFLPSVEAINTTPSEPLNSDGCKLHTTGTNLS